MPPPLPTQIHMPFSPTAADGHEIRIESDRGQDFRPYDSTIEATKGADTIDIMPSNVINLTSDKKEGHSSKFIKVNEETLENGED